MFCLTEFVDDSSMATVPATWLAQNRKSCLWPPVRNINAADRMARKKCLPDGTWKTYSVRVLFSAETYNEARGKLAATEITSDLQSQVEDNSKENYCQARKKRKKRRYLSSSEIGEESSIESVPRGKKSDENTEDQLPNAPAVVAVPLADSSNYPLLSIAARVGDPIDCEPEDYPADHMTADIDPIHAQVPLDAQCADVSFSANPVSQLGNVNSMPPGIVSTLHLCQHNQLRGSASVDSNITPKAAPAVHRSDGQNTIDASHNAVVMHMSAASSRHTASSSPRINPTFAASSVAVSSGQRVQQRDEFERKLLMALEELKSSMAQNTPILQMLQASSIAAADVPYLPGDVQLPVATVRDLQLLDDKLHDDELLGKALITRLAVIGGDDIKSTVANVMSAVLTPDLAQKLNWCGRGTKGKAAFRNLKLLTIIYKAVRRDPYCKRPSETDYCKVAKEWLRLAYDRNSGRKAREQRKRLHGDDRRQHPLGNLCRHYLHCIA